MSAAARSTKAMLKGGLRRVHGESAEAWKLVFQVREKKLSPELGAGSWLSRAARRPSCWRLRRCRRPRSPTGSRCSWCCRSDVESFFNVEMKQHGLESDWTGKEDFNGTLTSARYSAKLGFSRPASQRSASVLENFHLLQLNMERKINWWMQVKILVFRSCRKAFLAWDFT